MEDDPPKAAPGGVGLLIIDMITDLDFSGGRALQPHALAAARRVAGLRAAADRLGVPVIFVNDNGGRWHWDCARMVEHARRPQSLGRELVELLEPGPGDYVLIKPQFSAFYATNLPAILPRLGITRLVLTGIAADVCVLFTAADAHMREYGLWVPADAVAAEDPQRTAWALEVMARSMGAETRPAADAPLEQWVAAAMQEAHAA